MFSWNQTKIVASLMCQIILSNVLAPIKGHFGEDSTFGGSVHCLLYDLLKSKMGFIIPLIVVHRAHSQTPNW